MERALGWQDEFVALQRVCGITIGAIPGKSVQRLHVSVLPTHKEPALSPRAELSKPPKHQKRPRTVKNSRPVFTKLTQHLKKGVRGPRASPLGTQNRAKNGFLRPPVRQKRGSPFSSKKISAEPSSYFIGTAFDPENPPARCKYLPWSLEMDQKGA